MTKREEIMRIFPDSLKPRWEHALLQVDKLQEIRLAIGQPVRIMTAGAEKFLSDKGLSDYCNQDIWCITEREINEILQNVCRHSLYAFENEIRQGFLTVPGGHRIGVAGQVVLSGDGSIRNITHIRFMNIRISHEVIGAADEVMNFLYQDTSFLNTLIIAPPGCGKTTLLRDIVRQVSDGNPYAGGKQVGVVDERSEIAGSFMGIPQNNVGMRTDVLDACPKIQGMMLLMRSMAPAVVAVDEIGNYEDMKALSRILKCGSSVLATVHVNSMEDIYKFMHMDKDDRDNSRAYRPEMIFDRYIFLEKRSGMCKVSDVLDKQGHRLKKQEFSDRQICA